MPFEGKSGLQTKFVINDQVSGYPTRTIETTASRGELDDLIRYGFVVRRNLIGLPLAAELGEAVLRLGQSEENQPGAEYLAGKSIYIRGLLDKDRVFHQLLRFEPVLSIARSLLGPQVWVDLEARMNYAGSAGVAVPWHGHLPVVPDPLPAFFCYPHQIHCLIYLDRVTKLEGALCLLPGSHTKADVRIPLGDESDQDGQVELFFEAGDAVLIHGNLWHRTAPSSSEAGFRRLLLLGYVPSWIRSDIGQHGVKAANSLTSQLAQTSDAELRELLGEFHW